MRFPFRPAAALAAAIALTGCASLPRERGYAQTGALVHARTGHTPIASPDTAVLTAPEIPTDPVTVDQAIQLAFLYNPKIREEYARIGLGRAELEDARRISNPSFGYSKLDLRGGDGTQTSRILSLSFADLLLLPARKRFAIAELERLQSSVAGQLLSVATDVEVAWYTSVSATQVAAMRNIIALAAERSADLAQRFFDAGNINLLQLEQEFAAAAQARIQAVRAAADNVRARSELAGLIGLPSTAAWTTLEQLPAPPTTTPSADALVPLALDQRLDLAAARQEVALREDSLGVTRRWRWLGVLDVGYERESEIDGSVIRGPSLALGLPIFNQGQGAIARAQAQLADARARLDGLVLGVHNQAQLGVQRLDVTRDIAERYRTALVPRRERIVARTQEQVNYMLKGIFELILAKQQEYDAYQEYLEAVRDYWTSRAELRRVVGGRLPDDAASLEPTIGVEDILPSAAMPAMPAMPGMDHSMSGMPASDPPPASAATPPSADPHAGHAMPMQDVAPDPHAGHAIPLPTSPEASMPARDPPATPNPPTPRKNDEGSPHSLQGDSP